MVTDKTFALITEDERPIHQLLGAGDTFDYMVGKVFVSAQGVHSCEAITPYFERDGELWFAIMRRGAVWRRVIAQAVTAVEYKEAEG
ncbi:MAG: hypothetical protein GY769_07925 [bacterium]|nr:hypothetical protein [bacterium]